MNDINIPQAMPQALPGYALDLLVAAKTIINVQPDRREFWMNNLHDAVLEFEAQMPIKDGAIVEAGKRKITFREALLAADEIKSATSKTEKRGAVLKWCGAMKGALAR